MLHIEELIQRITDKLMQHENLEIHFLEIK